MLLSKVCTGCGRDLPLQFFYKRKAGLGGHDSRCKECIAEYRKRRYHDVPEVREKVKARARKWQEDNPERASKIKKGYYKRKKGHA